MRKSPEVEQYSDVETAARLDRALKRSLEMKHELHKPPKKKRGPAKPSPRQRKTVSR